MAHNADNQVKQRKWREQSIQGTYLGARKVEGKSGIVIGIVGLGRCGSRVAELLNAWSVRLLACDPCVKNARFSR